MKTTRVIVVLFVIGVAVASYIFTNVIEYYSKRSKSGKPKTPEEAMQRLQAIGELPKVRREADELLTYFSTNTSELFLSSLAALKYPAISSLGNSVQVLRDSVRVPVRLDVQYGTHFQVNYIYIYGQNVTPDPAIGSVCIVIGSNIFLSHH